MHFCFLLMIFVFSFFFPLSNNRWTERTGKFGANWVADSCAYFLIPLHYKAALLYLWHPQIIFNQSKNTYQECIWIHSKHHLSLKSKSIEYIMNSFICFSLIHLQCLNEYIIYSHLPRKILNQKLRMTCFFLR